MLPILHPDAAGIDIGAEEIFVAVPPDRDIDSVRRFDTFTRDLFALADWLRQCNIRSVAMESTGVYWIPLYQILETHGFEVFLVNAHHVKTFPVARARFGLSVDSVFAFGWTTKGEFSAARRDLRVALALAAPRRSHSDGS
jgi:hypothetical protein